MLQISKCLMAQDCCLLWKGFWWRPLGPDIYSVLLSLKYIYSQSSRVSYPRQFRYMSSTEKQVVENLQTAVAGETCQFRHRAAAHTLTMFASSGSNCILDHPSLHHSGTGERLPYSLDRLSACRPPAGRCRVSDAWEVASSFARVSDPAWDA